MRREAAGFPGRTGAGLLACEEELGEHLFAVAYRMIGTVAEAEDLVQEAWLRWSALEDRDRTASPRAYLTTVVTRLAIDHLRSARVRRESYVGPWLPEPLATDRGSAFDRVELEESITLAFLALLESLTPRQRAVFILREAFGMPHDRIAGILDVSEPNSRQILRRARDRVRSGRPRFEPAAAQHEALIRRFRAAARSGDLDALTELLARDAVAVTDGGGKARAALNPIRGQDRVARFVAGAVARFAPRQRTTTIVHVNAAPAILATADGQPAALITADIRDGRIATLYVVTNPEKLRALGRTTEGGGG